MALEDGTPTTSFTPEVVARAFVKQYYHTLRYAREDTYKFYNDSSILGRTDSNGKMTQVTTIDDIKEQLVTDFADFLIEIETVDAQSSHVDGVLILVAGYFTVDAVKQMFTQSFFLAPQENSGYYVLNDMFRLNRIPTEVKEVVAHHDNKSTQITTLPNGEVTSTSANIVSPVKNDVVVGTCSKDIEKIPEASTLTAVKAVNKGFEKIPEAAPAPRAPVEKAAPAPRAPVKKAAPARPAPVEKAAPTPPAPVEKAAPAPHAPVEKAAPSPHAPVEKAAPAPHAPVEKAVPAPPTTVVKAAPAPPSSDEKKTYASIVKTMSTQPAPAAKPAKPNPRPKAAQNVEKNVSSPSKPAPATDNALPADKSVPKTRSPDEPGYSIFVKNLPFDATVEMVKQEFSKFGAIKSGGIQVKCQPDQFCFGFVEFESQQSMLAAIEAATVYFGRRESYVEEKRTKTRVVDGVITHWNDDGGGSRFQSGRGGYYGDNYKQQWGGQNDGYYHDRDNTRSDYSGRGARGPQGNGYQQNNNGYHHQNGNGNSGKGYQQRRPSNSGNGRGPDSNNNGNGRVERDNGPKQQGPAAS